MDDELTARVQLLALLYVCWAIVAPPVKISRGANSVAIFFGMDCAMNADCELELV
jgi:hypothetical protein